MCIWSLYLVDERIKAHTFLKRDAHALVGLRPKLILSGNTIMQSKQLVEGPDYDAILERLSTAVSNEEKSTAMESAVRSILNTYASTGLQATNFARAEQMFHKMIQLKQAGKAKIGLAYTSNLISCGVRESLAWLCQHRIVDVVVTTGGGVEEDVIKCLGPTVIGDFALKGEVLRKEGLNRIGNLLVPNNNYIAFEEFFRPASTANPQRAAREWADWPLDPK